MTFEEYKKQAAKTRLPSADYEYLLMNLSGEVGELLSLEAKARRDGYREGHIENLEKELGDILWHVAMIAHDNFLNFDDVAMRNLEKLIERQQRGTIQGSGDDR